MIDRIAAVGQSDRTEGSRRADLFGDVTVRPGLPIRDRQQRFPDSPLEVRSNKIKLEVELSALAREVGVELVDCV